MSPCLRELALKPRDPAGGAFAPAIGSKGCPSLIPAQERAVLYIGCSFHK
uniref:Uncharacterized protein n=1 Tax=Picea glauca TaxID=3330 RepID=A0A101M576_PICGL|nr:hypothetical protein ABT39_MTgene1010 [Picea glauca]QHR87333.1 hypothetical protein Q903MT_gene1343 [Picea sitchensis]